MGDMFQGKVFVHPDAT